jgi:glutathione S-transferase
MITVYGFGSYFGLPDGSPFVTKAMLLLKLAGLEYRFARGDVRRAPKGKLPFIDDDGVQVCDSEFIRDHIERKYGFQFDKELNKRQQGMARAVQLMAENHLYWAIVDLRWCNDENFARSTSKFLDHMPAVLRPVIKLVARRQVAAAVRAHGFGRHTQAEKEMLAIRDVQALADLLGQRLYMMGETPTAVDAAVFAQLAALLCPAFESPIRTAAEAHLNLVAYRNHMIARYFPEIASP